MCNRRRGLRTCSAHAKPLQQRKLPVSTTPHPAGGPLHARACHSIKSISCSAYNQCTPVHLVFKLTASIQTHRPAQDATPHPRMMRCLLHHHSSGGMASDSHRRQSSWARSPSEVCKPLRRVSIGASRPLHRLLGCSCRRSLATRLLCQILVELQGEIGKLVGDQLQDLVAAWDDLSMQHVWGMNAVVNECRAWERQRQMVLRRRHSSPHLENAQALADAAQLRHVLRHLLDCPGLV